MDIRSTSQVVIVLIFTYVFVRAVGLLKETFRGIRWLQINQEAALNHIASSHPDSWPHLVLLLPVLREVNELPHLLAHMRTLKYPQGKLTIITITTEREIAEQPSHHIVECLSTVELAPLLTAQHNDSLGYELFANIHYPYRDGNKAAQLNYA